MQAPSGQMTGPALRALLAGAALAGESVRDPRRPSIRLQTRSMGFRVNGVFPEVSGHGTVSADGDVSGTLAVAAAGALTVNQVGFGVTWRAGGRTDERPLGDR